MSDAIAKWLAAKALYLSLGWVVTSPFATALIAEGQVWMGVEGGWLISQHSLHSLLCPR